MEVAESDTIQQLTAAVLSGLFVVLERCPQKSSSIVAEFRVHCSMWGVLVPRPGIEPMSPALEGRFLTTGPPGKSQEGIAFISR